MTDQEPTIDEPVEAPNIDLATLLDELGADRLTDIRLFKSHDGEHLIGGYVEDGSQTVVRCSVDTGTVTVVDPDTLAFEQSIGRGMIVIDNDDQEYEEINDLVNQAVHNE